MPRRTIEARKRDREELGRNIAEYIAKSGRREFHELELVPLHPQVNGTITKLTIRNDIFYVQNNDMIPGYRLEWTTGGNLAVKK